MTEKRAESTAGHTDAQGRRIHLRPLNAQHPGALLTRRQKIPAAIHARKHNRERQRRLKHGHRAQREGTAIRRLRLEAEAIDAILSKPKVMFDSVTVSEIPDDARAGLGYVGGSWPTFANGELRAHLPHALLIGIGVSSSHTAEGMDIEPGDASPEDAVDFVLREHARGIARPLLYASVSEMVEVLGHLDRGRIHPKAYRIGTAHVGAGKHICGPTSCGLLPVRADGTQHTWTSHGRNLDEWLLRPSFWVGR